LSSAARRRRRAENAFQGRTRSDTGVAAIPTVAAPADALAVLVVMVMVMVGVPMIVRVDDAVDVFVRMSMLAIPCPFRELSGLLALRVGWFEP